METAAGFSDKVVLVVLDKGLLALIVLVAGFYLNRLLETLKGKISREGEFRKTANQAVVELTKKLGAASQRISWLSWVATDSSATLVSTDFDLYDKEMIVVLGELVGLEASVAALSKSSSQVLTRFADQLYARDIEVSQAKHLFRSGVPANVKQSLEILKKVYQASLTFDAALRDEVCGLLEAPTAG